MTCVLDLRNLPPSNFTLWPRFLDLSGLPGVVHDPPRPPKKGASKFFLNAHSVEKQNAVAVIHESPGNQEKANGDQQ